MYVILAIWGDLSTLFMITGYRFPIEESNLFKLSQLEKEEVDRLKWIESEKAGYDIGIHRARWIWYTKHRSHWVHHVIQNGGTKDQH